MKKKIDSWNTKRFTFDMTEEQYHLLVKIIKGYIEGNKEEIEHLMSPNWWPHWEMCYRQEEIFKRKEKVHKLKDLYDRLIFPVKKEKQKDH